MSYQPVPNIPDPARVHNAGQYFHYMAQFVGFTQEDSTAIRQSALVIEKHLPAIIGRFYTNLLQYPPTRKFFLKRDGSLDENYLQLRMFHQANFWRRAAGGEYDDEFAHFVDYVGRAHTSHGADPHLYIAERYVIGMVGFVQHAIIEALHQELHEYDPDLQMRATRAWNKLCMVILEMLARAYSEEHEIESDAGLLPVDPQAVHQIAVDSYEKGLGMRRDLSTRDILVAQVTEIGEGERKIVDVDGVSIGVFHHKGNWHALRNSCLHRGGPVCTGKLEGDRLICPWHGYTYDVTDGHLLIDSSAHLEKYPVVIQDDQVYLRLPAASEMAPAAPASKDLPLDGQRAPAERPALKENEFFIKDLPAGKSKKLRLNGQDVAVYNVDSQFYATSDECTHAGGPLSEGELDGHTVICPWHFSCFDVITGAATCGPAREAVKTFKVTIDGETGKVEES